MKILLDADKALGGGAVAAAGEAQLEAKKKKKKKILLDFPDGPVVRNPPTKAGNMGSIPGLRRFHIPWGN